MELFSAAPADIWRLLIPSSHWLYRDEVPEDELIFHYRDQIYFVNNDGSVISLPKPAAFELMDLGELLDHLATSDCSYDYDDSGEFDYASVLLRMGYLVPTGSRRERADHLVEIVNTLAPEKMVTRYELPGVCFTFALYHGLLRCHELNRKCDWEFEHEIKSIKRAGQYEAKHFHLHS
ncbi:hypothetical protein [Brevibacillus migulae]|uniref:hypothetical protein n=1 Tax=Brevibacillus migulae TaxID=1644114 RepID=UPI00106DEDE1|nr:hypothetical protein [Brevibacillus migulae]